jgi:hypothetical protein
MRRRKVKLVKSIARHRPLDIDSQPGVITVYLPHFVPLSGRAVAEPARGYCSYSFSWLPIWEWTQTFHVVRAKEGSDIMSSRRVTIVGAGLSRTLMAVFLARCGGEVNVYEGRGDLRYEAVESGRSINLTITTRGLDALRRAGLHEVAIDRLCTVLRSRAVHDRTGETMYIPYGVRPHEVLYSISRTALTKFLSGIPGIRTPTIPYDATHVYFFYPLLVQPETIGADTIPIAAFRDALIECLTAEGANTQRWQPRPLPAQTLFQQQRGYGRGCPWTCGHARPGIEYAGEAYPVATDICERRLVLGQSFSSLGPPNDVHLMHRYTNAFYKVLVEHRADLLTFASSRVQS